MRDWLTSLFTTARLSSPAQIERARAIYGVTLVLLVVYTLFVLEGSATDEAAGPAAEVLIIVFYMLAVATVFLTRQGNLRAAAAGPVLMIAVSVGALGIQGGYIDADDAVPLVGIVLMGGLLGRERGLLLSTGLALVMFGLGVAARSTITIDAARNTDNLITLPIGILGVAGVTYLFLRSTRFSQLEGVAQATEDRLKLAEISTGIAQRISRRSALGDVLSSAVDQITAAYPTIYHAQIFLIDETRQHAQLAASTGAAGRLLLQRKHSLDVGSESVIGRVTADGQAIIARSDAESVHKRNEFLPDTVVEAAFPLRIGDTTIGALDLQSKIATSFNPTDIPIFQALADNLAVAIDNARLFEETERQLSNNQRLIEQTRAAAQEVERLNSQLTLRAWERFLDNKDQQLGMSVDFNDHTMLPLSELTPAQLEAMQRNDVVHTTTTAAQVVAIPLRVRGQVIGAMEFELDADGMLSAEDLELVEQVSERFGLAVENSRLFDESQRIAYREAMVNEISTRLQASNNVETVLGEAARSLKQTLGVGRVAIRLGTPPALSTQGTRRS